MAENPTTASDLTVSARELSRRFGGADAVRAIDLHLRRGEVLGLLGPNGAGKTTTMQMLTGNLAPSAGSVSICGIDLLERPTAAKARIGYLPEVPPLYKELTVDEYLRLAARLHRVPRSELPAAVARAKQRCGVSDMGARLIATLSKGYQQRVGIAQAIIHTPDVVILDEPTVGLDPNQIREIRALIRELSDNHSVILSTHILPEVEAVCDRVQILHRGSIVYGGTIDELRRFRGGHALVVGLRQAPALEALTRVPGVARVERTNEGMLRLFQQEGQDPTDAVVRSSVEHGWGLYHLAPERASLEDVFVHLTQLDTAGQAEAGREAA
jgi:ABC-2 type transport system ATP-binding protein